MLTLLVALLLGGDFYTGSVLASTLTKLVLRYGELEGTEAQKANALKAEVCPRLPLFRINLITQR